MKEINSLKRAFDILNLYTPGNPNMGIKDVSQKLEISKSTAARTMITLEACGMLKQKEETRTYFLSKKVVELARVFLSNTDIKTIAMPFLKELAEKTDESIRLHIIEGEKRLCLAWIDSNKPVRPVVGPNDIYGPLHAGAPGKLILAYLPEEKVNIILDKTGMQRYTEFTITSRKELFAELQKVRNQGFAISKGEHLELVNTISAPIRNFFGEVVAALGICWVIRKSTSERENKYAELVKDSAYKVSQELGYIWSPSSLNKNGISK